MDGSLINEIDSQITCLQQILCQCENLKKKVIKLEVEKNEMYKKYEDLKCELERLSSKKCTNCSLLKNELQKERKEKENLKQEEKSKLLTKIVKVLENLDDGNTNQVTNAQIFTELVCARFNESEEHKRKNENSLIPEDSSEDEDKTRILVNETLIVSENEEAGGVVEESFVVPETEAMQSCSPKINKIIKDNGLSKFQNRNPLLTKENVISVEYHDEIEQANKKLRLSPVLTSVNISSPRNSQSARSPSVLSEILEAAGCSSAPRSDEVSNCQRDKEVAWKMKPSTLLEGNTNTTNGKKMKQMTLSLSRAEKKHDISLSEGFKGGVAKHSDEDNDVILPSPERFAKTTFPRKVPFWGTLEDPDITVFNPPITSTCLPHVGAETSFDRLPQAESPTYKYRRDTVRKRAERMKLPGQDCDDCARYYAAAGINQSQVKGWLNQCSRHRDKYQLRANTPPGFWDPVLPTTPEGSQ